MKRARCLVVDDEVSNLDLLGRALERDFEVVKALSGDEALALMDRSRFAAVIADHRMPGLSGVELLELAEKRDPDMLRLMLTAFDDVPEVLHARRMGIAAAVLVKPIPPDMVCHAVHRWLAHVRDGEIPEQEDERRGDPAGGT